MAEATLVAVLRERASLQPNDIAFEFVDYFTDPAGVSETATWSQMHRRCRAVARRLRQCGTAGDRALILAPQGLDYVAAFLGALQAGLIAVPFSIPFGADDERVHSVLQDSSPTVILTTTALATGVTEYARPQGDRSAPSVVAVDSLDRDTPADPDVPNPVHPECAYLQYTSGSTRTPAGVEVSHRNVAANFGQVMATYFAEHGNVAPPETTVVSWVPLYHNMGLFIGVCAPILAGLRTVLTSPLAFIDRPVRWLRLLAENPRSFSPAPNFALDMAVRSISDAELAGIDLGDVQHLVCGGERIHAGTLRRFATRFARFNLSDRAIRPSYGLAEATVYVATRPPGDPPRVVHFDTAKLSVGRAERCSHGGIALVSYGAPGAPTVRIVDPDSRTECPPGTVGEIWVSGASIAIGYWRKPQETQRTFGAQLVDPTPGTPDGPWLRTGDLGAVSDGELFIMGRIKDVVIVYGRNHYPEDIEATIQEVTRGRVVAIAVPGERTEQLVAIVELDDPRELGATANDVTSAVATAHGLGIADLVLVAPGAIPITASGKVRRVACVDQYRRNQFIRWDRQRRGSAR